MSDPSGQPPADRWRRADAIFERALEAPPGHRAALVAEACADDAELRREVESLLKADEQAGDFLEPPLPATTGGIGPAEAPRLDPGTILAARYRIDAHAGQGGMGLVYRARDLVLDTDVAVKLLDPAVLARPGQREAFRREVRLARRVTHPNVCRVHDIVEDGALTFITMEYVPGESLAERLARGGTPAADWTRRALTDILRGLQAVHVAGVIHRDLKPANVLLRPGSDEAVVADFGVAADPLAAGAAARAGTRGYMAPEQAAGAAPDVRSDLFSFGVLAHRLAAGVLPGEPSAVAVPPALARLVEACLRPDPEERPGSASEALALLEGGGRREAARVRRLAAAALVAVAVALGSMAWWRIHPTSGAEVLVAPVDTAQLEARERWLGDAVRQMVVNDLMDAWAVDARAAPDASVPPQATLRPRLWRDGDGRLQASLAVPGEHGFQDVRGDSLRDVAEGLARRTVERTVPAALRHPTARELREVCARDPEAWRQLRRARRAARMEHWARVRRLAGDAVARDPGFCMAWLELGLTYDDEDQARGPLLDKAVTLGDAAPGLSPLSRLGVEFARRSRAGDAAGVARVLEDLAALKLQGPDQLYVRTRMALIPFTRGEPETGLPLLERISEEWPRDAAAPKRLADHYLGQGEVSLLPVALRYARTAVSLAPEDVGARASLARALALAGDEASAREQAAVLAMADAGEKQGGSLFDLHMTLGDVEAAAVDARRLLAEPGVPHAHGLAALGTIDLARGDFDQGLAKLDAAAAEYERLHVDGFALLTRWRLAWQSFSLGRPVRPASAPGDSLSGKYARCIAIVAALARMQAGEARDEAATVALRQEIGRLPAETAWMMERATFELILRHARQDWAGVVAGYRDLASRTAPVAAAYYAGAALERLGRPDEAARVYERLATHPSAWLQPYRRGQAWLRLGILRQRKGDAAGARQAFQSLLGLWDHAPRGLPEIREAERRLKALPG